MEKLQNASPLLVLAISLLVISISGCNVMYTPPVQNIPLLQEKGDIKATINLQNIQGAYGLTSNIGVMVNGSYHLNEWEIRQGSNTLAGYKSRRYNLEGGFGCYKKTGEKGLFEVFSGAGFGQVSYDNHLINLRSNQKNELKFSGNTRNYFVQPSFGLVGQKMEMAFSTRLVALKFNNLTQLNYTDELLQKEKIYRIDKPVYMFAEPALTLRYGLPWLKIQSQFIYSAKLNKDNLNYNPLKLNFSLQFDLSARNRNRANN